MFMPRIVAVIALLPTACVSSGAGEDAPVVRATFRSVTLYSSATGLVTRKMCGEEDVSLSAPIDPTVLRDVVRLTLESDFFSVDTGPKPIRWSELKPRDKERFKELGVAEVPEITVLESGCWTSGLDISMGRTTHRRTWSCQSNFGEREEIQRLERALAKYVEKLPASNCFLR